MLSRSDARSNSNPTVSLPTVVPQKGTLKESTTPNSNTTVSTQKGKSIDSIIPNPTTAVTSQKGKPIDSIIPNATTTGSFQKIKSTDSTVSNPPTTIISQKGKPSIDSAAPQDKTAKSGNNRLQPGPSPKGTGPKVKGAATKGATSALKPPPKAVRSPTVARTASAKLKQGSDQSESKPSPPSDPTPNLPDATPIIGAPEPAIIVAELNEEAAAPDDLGTMKELMKSRMERPAQNNTGGAIGHTPMVYLNNIPKGLNAKIAVKLEYMNPAGSVKDRVGFNMIEDAEKKGLITPGKTVLIEPTSGNMGIALAFVARIKGYKLILCMPASMSVERRSILKAYGAEVILTDPATAVKGAMQRARELCAAMPNCYMLNQFGNPANVDAHYRTTGPEVLDQTGGKVDIVCYGVGSGGTLSGVGKYLKEKKPEVEVYAVEPYESSVINGLPHSPHKIQGMGTGFIPDILDRTIIKEALRVHSDDALAMAKRLATEEAILGGISSGANVCAAVELAKRPENAGKLIVTNINSFGERYLSTTLYSDIRDAAEKMGVQSLEESLEAAKSYIATESP